MPVLLAGFTRALLVALARVSCVVADDDVDSLVLLGVPLLLVEEVPPKGLVLVVLDRWVPPRRGVAVSRDVLDEGVDVALRFRVGVELFWVGVEARCRRGAGLVGSLIYAAKNPRSMSSLALVSYPRW